MDANRHRSASESSSLSTSGEYEILSPADIASISPKLDTHNRSLHELETEMSDALRDLGLGGSSGFPPQRIDIQIQAQQADVASITSGQLAKPTMTLPLRCVTSQAPLAAAAVSTSNSSSSDEDDDEVPQVLPVALKAPAMTPGSEEGGSISEPNREFYDCIDASPAAAQAEAEAVVAKFDKSETTEDEISEIDQGCTIFSGVTYLGAANISAPKSEQDIYRIMSELHNGTKSGMKIMISIPNSPDGVVVLHDAETSTIIATYEVHSIILYYRGPLDTAEHGCFAFTWLHGVALYQCHIFRCHIPEAVNQVSACFQKAFQTYPPSMTCSIASAVDAGISVTSDISGNQLNTAGYEFIVSLEIREKVAKNSYSSVPRDRGSFRLRAHTDKELCIVVKQSPSNILQPLFIERCFGVLVSPGKLIRQADMQLIDMVSMGYAPAAATTIDNAVIAPLPPCLTPYNIRAEWKANEKPFEQLNVESTKTFLTVAVDIVIRGIQEPVRFVIETPVAIQSAGDLRIMEHFMSKRPMTLRFYLHLTRTTDEYSWQVNSIDPSEEIATEPPPQQQSSSYLQKFGMPNWTRVVRSSSIASIEDVSPTDYSSDGDEPLLSGTGEVSKDCSQDTLDEWDPILREWEGEKRPKNLAYLVRNGIPEALREKVWQKLANVETKTDMHDMYKVLITKETNSESVILRDLHRTFPAHKSFKEIGGSGQDALYKVSKAYAVYDSEVGYCQGLSFISASLLLHMPEEDAFCVLVALMYDYGLREFYKTGFEALYLRLHQLNRLIKEQLPKLHEHFTALGIESHMFAAQWFLTLFTARFPLSFVYHVLDVFLLDGIAVLLQVGLTLLSICESELRQLDFEGILKYFRVSLPKKVRNPNQARKIMKLAAERKLKKLKQYEEEFLLQRQNEERLAKETQMFEARFGDERRKLQAKIEEAQQRLNEANARATEIECKHQNIIQDYKQIIQRLEREVSKLSDSLYSVMDVTSTCASCLHKIENNDRQRQSAQSFSEKKEHRQARGMEEGEPPLGPLDPIHAANQRIRELELELAQAKLAQVEAECQNQDLTHQLSTAMHEMQTNRNSWQPWISKTFNTLQEKVRSNRDVPASASFQSYVAANAGNAGSERNSPSSNQDYEPFSFSSLSGSPKLTAKFQPTAAATARLRTSIDSLRNIVGPLDANNSSKSPPPSLLSSFTSDNAKQALKG